MTITVRDSHILWSRAGGRCAFPDCRIALTPTGDTLLGEMAHIVARSPRGPRGELPLADDERDHYQNLILLCPTHHRLIDEAPDRWTEAQLHRLKEEHERWVTLQLERGLIDPITLAGEDFLARRRESWQEIAGDETWIVTALTPLGEPDLELLALGQPIREMLQGVPLPRPLHDQLGIRVNPYHVETSHHGMVAENFSRHAEGVAYRFEVFRSGHFEFLTCLEAATNAAAPLIELRENPLGEAIRRIGHRRQAVNRLLAYPTLIETIWDSFDVLDTTWEATMPTGYRIATATVIAGAGLTVYHQSGAWNFVIGRPTEEPQTSYSFIVEPEYQDSRVKLVSEVATRLGLTVGQVYDGERLLPPRR